MAGRRIDKSSVSSSMKKLLSPKHSPKKTPKETPKKTPEKTQETPVANSSSGKKFTFFFQKESPFSQHHACKFSIEGIGYNCAEQYMMHQKAVLFKDHESAEQILTAKSPVVQKRLGRKVKLFDPRLWDSKCVSVVRKGNMAKFKQNPDLKKKLFETGGTTLVEASPFDRKWGIGMDVSKAAACDPSKWRGKNLLGKILTEVREELLACELTSQASLKKFLSLEKTTKETDKRTPEKAQKTPVTNSSPKKKFTFFFQKESPFSLFHACRFSVEGVRYNCALQYMMHQKAVLFNDHETAKQIMTAQSPDVQKRLGRKVKPFDPRLWDSKCVAVAREGNMAKFKQNPDLKKKLFETGGTTLVEASPFDRKWGIGMAATNAAVRDPSKWRGKNLLGEILTEVREELLACESALEEWDDAGDA